MKEREMKKNKRKLREVAPRDTYTVKSEKTAKGDKPQFAAPSDKKLKQAFDKAFNKNKGAWEQLAKE